ncbi:hypothetical protein ENBRE01_1674 [Enteropsectra breve]|nr:hypothetical protein ENBRE01_1674 [Enteropsectra breve]
MLKTMIAAHLLNKKDEGLKVSELELGCLSNILKKGEKEAGEIRSSLDAESLNLEGYKNDMNAPADYTMLLSYMNTSKAEIKTKVFDKLDSLRSCINLAEEKYDAINSEFNNKKSVSNNNASFMDKISARKELIIVIGVLLL